MWQLRNGWYYRPETNPKPQTQPQFLIRYSHQVVWFGDKRGLWKSHFTGDSVFDITEGDDVQEKQLSI